jgi:hypothetical protein
MVLSSNDKFGGSFLEIPTVESTRGIACEVEDALSGHLGPLGPWDLRHGGCEVGDIMEIMI